MRPSLRLLLITAWVTVTQPGWTLDVRWAVADGPPFHMNASVGPNAGLQDLGNGLLDQQIQGIARHAPELHHQFVALSRARMWRAMQAGQPLCYANAFRTPERLKLAHFTPVSPPTPMVLVTRKGLLPEAGEVSLAALLARSDLHGVFEADRSYGTNLDGLIQAAGAQVRIMALPDSPVLLRMLEAGRMDYLVEDPSALLYMQEQLQPRPALDFHALLEDRDPQATYVACTRSAWGRQVIQHLDAAIRKWAATPEAARSVLRWLPPGVAQREQERVQTFFRQRALSGQVE